MLFIARTITLGAELWPRLTELLCILFIVSFHLSFKPPLGALHFIDVKGDDPWIAQWFGIGRDWVRGRRIWWYLLIFLFGFELIFESILFLLPGAVDPGEGLEGIFSDGISKLLPCCLCFSICLATW